MTIAGVHVDIGHEAVVVRADEPLTTASSAVVGGGLGRASAIVNLHVPKNFRGEHADGVLEAFVARRSIPAPWVGLLTGAWTEKAEIATETIDGITAVAIVTVGLSNPASAGRTAVAAWLPSTINTILVVDAVATPAALVNLVMTVTEAKVMVVAEAGVRTLDGDPASGTSTDAIVIAASGRGRRCEFGGPVSDLGWAAARAARAALSKGVDRWMREHA
jgi:adenosylcobinamide amidohydrolase